MKKSRKTWYLLSWLFFVLLSLWSATFQSIKESDFKILRVLYNQHVFVVLGLALIMILLRFLGWFYYNRDMHKQRLESFLESLHLRYFPAEDNVGANPEYRVTLFVPGRSFNFRFEGWKPRLTERKLKFFARSTDVYPETDTEWSIEKSEKRDYDGIAGYAWVTGTFVTKDNLPEYANSNEEEKQDYLERTYITKEQAKNLNVKSRSYRALVVRSQTGDKKGVLMMESENPKGLEEITSDSFRGDAMHLKSLFM